jgi:hypothetical protein
LDEVEISGTKERVSFPETQEKNLEWSSVAFQELKMIGKNMWVWIEDAITA